MFDITAEKAAAAAKLSFAGSPEHALASQICRLRGVNPDGLDPMNPAMISNWQFVIAEQILEATLRHALQRSQSTIVRPVPFQ